VSSGGQFRLRISVGWNEVELSASTKNFRNLD
jgi:hypothetical protein